MKEILKKHGLISSPILYQSDGYLIDFLKSKGHEFYEDLFDRKH